MCIRDSIYTLKQLQEFLGTMNYIRPHCGPEYCRVAEPLRPLLKPGASFPPNEPQLKALDALKDLAMETHRLAVPDERAAIEAARAWMAKKPAAGHPYEGGADTSKIAVGGALGQARQRAERLHFLMYWSGALTASQSQWHPFQQELYGLLMLKREAVKHFGRIPMVLHTDHGTITRLEYLPVSYTHLTLPTNREV